MAEQTFGSSKLSFNLKQKECQKFSRGKMCYATCMFAQNRYQNFLGENLLGKMD
jgi:hypothetical protein